MPNLANPLANPNLKSSSAPDAETQIFAYQPERNAYHQGDAQALATSQPAPSTPATALDKITTALCMRPQVLNLSSLHPLEINRALNILTILYGLGDIPSLRILTHYAGVALELEQGSLNLSQQTAKQLALALERAGYPLNDAGMKRFKLERGYGENVTLGPELALAYTRFASGLETKINLRQREWQDLSPEERLALQLLLVLGQRPEELQTIRDILGMQNTETTPKGTLLVGKASAVHFVKWLHKHRLSLTPEGLQTLAKTTNLTFTTLENLAAFLYAFITSKDEPRHNYQRINYQGHPLNKRTANMLQRVASQLPPDLTLSVCKGSYQTGYAKGAHPHLGGGVVDLNVTPDTAAAWSQVLLILRNLGFAAWLRERPDRPLHIHAIAIGDRESTPTALWQVKAYFAGLDGRTKGGPDPQQDLSPYLQLPAWVHKYRLKYQRSL